MPTVNTEIKFDDAIEEVDIEDVDTEVITNEVKSNKKAKAASPMFTAED